MELIYTDTGTKVKAGDVLKCSRDEVWVVNDIVGHPPHKSSSSGKINVISKDKHYRSFYPAVFNCKWIDPVQEFMDSVYEIAFGEGALDKGYRDEEVLEKLKEYSTKAWQYDELQ